MVGGNTATRLVVSAGTDVFTVEGGIVRGQGQWSHFSEPRAVFERHFVAP